MSSPAPYTELQQKKYRIIRSASHGADLSLVSSYDGYHAAYDCAEKLSKVLGDAGRKDFGGVPAYVVALADMPRSLEKLSEQYSVAILDQLPNDKNNLAWGLVWKIRRGGSGAKVVEKKVEKEKFATVRAVDYSLEDF